MLLKRGQTDQTIFLHKPKEFKGYEIGEGLGFENLHYLERAISQVPTLYDDMYFNIAKEYRMQFTKSSMKLKLDMMNVGKEKR